MERYLVVTLQPDAARFFFLETNRARGHLDVLPELRNPDASRTAQRRRAHAQWTERVAREICEVEKELGLGVLVLAGNGMLIERLEETLARWLRRHRYIQVRKRSMAIAGRPSATDLHHRLFGLGLLPAPTAQSPVGASPLPGREARQPMFSPAASARYGSLEESATSS